MLPDTSEIFRTKNQIGHIMKIIKLFGCIFVLLFANFGLADTGSTGNPTNWVQIGETQDTFLQLDANSILGFKTNNGVLAHRADYRYKGKVDNRLTSKAHTAFMIQEDCDTGKGNITIFPVGPDGQPNGKGDTYEFDLSDNRVYDAVAKTMCKARKIMSENQRLTK